MALITATSWGLSPGNVRSSSVPGAMATVPTSVSSGA